MGLRGNPQIIVPAPATPGEHFKGEEALLVLSAPVWDPKTPPKKNPGVPQKILIPWADPGWGGQDPPSQILPPKIYCSPWGSWVWIKQVSPLPFSHNLPGGFRGGGKGEPGALRWRKLGVGFLFLGSAGIGPPPCPSRWWEKTGRNTRKSSGSWRLSL